MFIPRVGQEVVVEFLEGNPDRPLITGVVYNANMTVPYALPDNKTRSTIKTNSSKGGSGFNELRFEDQAGQEEVFFQAQKDYNKVVLNDETVTIHNDTDDDGGDRRSHGDGLAGRRHADGFDRQSHDHRLRRQEFGDGGAVDHACRSAPIRSRSTTPASPSTARRSRCSRGDHVAAGRRSVVADRADDIVELRRRCQQPRADPDFADLLQRDAVLARATSDGGSAARAAWLARWRGWCWPIRTGRGSTAADDRGVDR